MNLVSLSSTRKYRFLSEQANMNAGMEETADLHQCCCVLSTLIRLICFRSCLPQLQYVLWRLQCNSVLKGPMWYYPETRKVLFPICAPRPTSQALSHKLICSVQIWGGCRKQDCFVEMLWCFYISILLLFFTDRMNWKLIWKSYSYLALFFLCFSLPISKSFFEVTFLLRNTVLKDTELFFPLT